MGHLFAISISELCTIIFMTFVRFFLISILSSLIKYTQIKVNENSIVIKLNSTKPSHGMQG